MRAKEELVAALRRKAAKLPDLDEEQIETDITKEFCHIFDQLREEEIKKDKTLAKIPRFFFKPRPSPSEPLYNQVRREARLRFLKRNESQLLETSDLDRFWQCLTDHISPPNDGKERINYDDFSLVRASLPAKFAPFLTPPLFLQLRADEWGRVGILPLFVFAVRMDALRNKRLSLSYYDSKGYGFMLDTDLESFVADQVAVFPSLEVLEQSFMQFYLCVAARKFMFFLDPCKTGKVRIRDLILSPILDDFLQLRHANIGEEELYSNWFSAQNAIRLYKSYMMLDVDKNGLLSKEELQNYGGRGFTSVFIDRIFAECPTYDDEMDFKAFVDFVLASENMKTEQGLQYFFRILDVRKLGYLTIFEINYFFRSVSQHLIGSGNATDVADVKDEIFDMVKPKDPMMITFDDLWQSGVGATVVSMLTDVTGFLEYDNRENMLAAQAEEERE